LPSKSLPFSCKIYGETSFVPVLFALSFLLSARWEGFINLYREFARESRSRLRKAESSTPFQEDDTYYVTQRVVLLYRHAPAKLGS